MRIVLQDKAFYQKSGGGVTLSGGEVLVQSEAAAELLKRLKKERISTALETSGYAAEDVFLRTIRNADLLLFDIKHYDSNHHMEGTGVTNERILKNLSLALGEGKDIIVRIPVIPGFNDSLRDARGFVRLLKKMEIKTVNLLPFHQLGSGKYNFLDLAYSYRDKRAIRNEELSEYQKIFEENGIETKIGG